MEKLTLKKRATWHTTCILAVATAALLSGCKTMPDIGAIAAPLLGVPAQAPAPAAASATGPQGCRYLGNSGDSTQATVVGGVGGALAGAALGSTMSRHGRVGARNGAILGAVVGAMLAQSAYNSQVSHRVLDDGSVKLDIPGKVLFATDSAEISPGFRTTPAQVAAKITEYCGVTARVVGHTDNTGALAHNLRLSRDRAMAVQSALRTMGVTRDIAVDGLGPNQPMAPNTTADGRATNRRVELFLIPPST